MNNPGSTERLYDQNYAKWTRKTKTSLSDFTARPKVFELLGDLNGKIIADLGCGEGYCSRNFIEQGASRVIGVDISEEMVAAAKKSIPSNQPEKFEFIKGDLSEKIPEKIFSADIFCSIFMFNYVSTGAMSFVLNQIKQHSLVKRPRLIFTLPHPFMPFINKVKYPFYFDSNDKNYYQSEGCEMSGSIYTIDGTELLVRNVHKTFSNIINVLAETGWVIDSLEELSVTPELIKHNPSFFSPLDGTPLHILVDAHSDG
jgi:SAM-dependent methyltransferase